VRALAIGGRARHPRGAPATLRRFRGRAPGILPLSCALLCALAPAAEGGATRIEASVTLGREVCTIEIQCGDLLVCAGQEVRLQAVLQCGDDYVPAREPQWFLGGEYLGEGEEILVTPPAGVHVLTANCGSCDDAIALTVLDDSECSLVPRLDALFSNDATEATTGVFLPFDPAPVSPADFAHRRYAMRPFVLTCETPVSAGAFTLAADGPGIEVRDQAGAVVALPASFEIASLPETLLVRGIAHGRTTLSAGYAGTAGRQELSDEVLVRVGAFPGLAGRALSGYPFFEFVAAVNGAGVLQGALDPGRHAERTGLPYRAYVVAHRSPEEWALDDGLIDVSGGYETSAVAAGSIAANVVTLWSTGLDAGSLFGRPYDVVYDFGLDGRLDPGDLIDGPGAGAAGISLVRDLTLAGPYPVTMIQYSGGTWLGQRTYYPTDVASLGALPLVVISHGNGHDYRWYDYLGYHLASYGYVVMAHENNTQPGIETASTTTLTNTDYLLANQATIGGGVLNGHIDGGRIVWIGHSRGGEGVVRAYDRVFDGTWVPTHYTLGDIACVSSIAPTVYLGTVDTYPHEVNYHMLFGAADGDVDGGCDDLDRQALRIAQAARGNVQVTYVQGAGHNDFNCCGWADAQGPNLIGRAEAQRVAKGYYLALIEHYTRGNVPARDYLTRMYGGFHPSGIAAHVVCADTYRDALATERLVIDDYQTNTALGTSSSGGAVAYDVSNAYEYRLDDGNLDFTWTASDPMNGMTRTDTGDIYQGGVVFDWTTGQQRYYELEIPAARRDFRDHAYLSFRACQGTRHPETVALNGPLTFTVSLRDGQGHTSTISLGVYGSISQPYQRSTHGTGTGWANEFNTVRIRLADFENDGSGIDLSDVVAVRFDFGSAHGSARGRIGLDDVELTRD